MVNPLNFGRGTELSSEVIRYLGLKSSPVKQYSHYVMFCGGFFNPKISNLKLMKHTEVTCLGSVILAKN